MESNKTMITAVIAILVLIGGGIGIYAATSSDDDAADESTTQTTEQAAPEPVAEAEEPAPATPNIVEAAVATPALSTLVAAVTEAELVDTLSGEGPFTLLAPTDDAFGDALAALELTAEELLARDDLGDILTYHVIAGNVLSTDLSDGMMVETVQGGMLEVDITDDGVFFVDANGGRAQVSTPDVETSNGTVHIIDAVLLP